MDIAASKAVVELRRPGRRGSRPAMMNILLATKRRSVGELVDFAKGMPIEWAKPLAVSIGESIASDGLSGRRRAVARRQLVILIALLTRIAMEVEEIPTDPKALI